MANEIQIIEGVQAIVEPRRMNYEVTVPNGGTAVLKRDVDFGVIPKTKKPSLYKSGAEKICFAYGLMQRYTIESKIEQWEGDNPFFYYLVRCDLVKLLPTGQEIVFTSGYGSANTKEKRNGFNGAFDAANGNLKMAQKRALVSAAISICGGSALFTQDIEDETFMKNYEEIKVTSADDAPVTSKQIKRLFAIGAEAGHNVNELKQMLAAQGFTSTKDIKQKDYDAICKLVGKDDGKEEAKEE